jgi:hypothetical protein
VLAALVTPGVLEVLGVIPKLGRRFHGDDRDAGSVMRLSLDIDASLSGSDF